MGNIWKPSTGANTYNMNWEQIWSAIHACEGRITNGADIDAAFQWLRDELVEIGKGAILYENN